MLRSSKLACRRALNIAAEAGVTLSYGSDLLGPLGVAQTKEFGLRSQALSTKQVLQSATVDAARLLREEEFLGQIKAGFSADLLVLNENPLEDILIFDLPEKHFLAVVKEGRVEASRWSKLPEDMDITRPDALIECLFSQQVSKVLGSLSIYAKANKILYNKNILKPKIHVYSISTPCEKR
ncbi:hypothetical protein ACJ72_01347 [Emergomyces africanus]|uniref:Amidohydrolase-related domain-containing protein n=1 Tax=Emergomyces africanus TaxID=1955775 RepID=A0A1B7P5G9_9EURO|nr:hypothetical protein ACJ72_01347 [Emergomyces africanus]